MEVGGEGGRYRWRWRKRGDIGGGGGRGREIYSRNQKDVTNTVYRLTVPLTVSVLLCAPFRSSVLPFRVHFSSCDRPFTAL